MLPRSSTDVDSIMQRNWALPSPLSTCTNHSINPPSFVNWEHPHMLGRKKKPFKDPSLVNLLPFQQHGGSLFLSLSISNLLVTYLSAGRPTRMGRWWGSMGGGDFGSHVGAGMGNLMGTCFPSLLSFLSFAFSLSMPLTYYVFVRMGKWIPGPMQIPCASISPNVGLHCPKL